MITFLRSCALLVAALVLAACASTGGTVAPNTQEVDVLPDSDPLGLELGRPEYRIGPNDLLVVTVFQIDDLGREVRVNNAGQINLPLIGAVNAASRTIGELEADIAGRYQARYLQNPQVSVFVKEFVSQRVTVQGAVKKSGIFPMATTSLSLLQAVALSEGLTDVADRRNVFVFRNVGNQRMVARFDLKAISEGRADDPRIQGEDIVVVSESQSEVWFQRILKLTPIVNAWTLYLARR